MSEEQLELSSAIEALLFSEGIPMKKTLLAQLLGVDLNEVNIGVETLRTQLDGRGLALIDVNDSVALRSAPQFSDLLRKVNTDAQNTELTKAALEVLSIIVYKESVGLADIDYIRGVNSSYSVRRLLTRGLIEVMTESGDSRKKVYRPTVELLAHLGITDTTDLPEFENVQKQIIEFEKRKEDE